MAIGITIAVASIIGIIYGIRMKKKPLAILSGVALILTIAIWVYFYINPY